MAIYKEIAFFPNINKVEMDINDDFYQIEDCLWDIEEIKAVNKQIEELRMNKKKASPLCKEVTLSKELLDKIFPVGCIYNILYDLWGDEEEQIKNGLHCLSQKKQFIAIIISVIVKNIKPWLPNHVNIFAINITKNMTP